MGILQHADVAVQHCAEEEKFTATGPCCVPGQSHLAVWVTPLQRRCMSPWAQQKASAVASGLEALVCENASGSVVHESTGRKNSI